MGSDHTPEVIGRVSVQRSLRPHGDGVAEAAGGGGREETHTEMCSGIIRLLAVLLDSSSFTGNGQLIPTVAIPRTKAERPARHNELLAPGVQRVAHGEGESYSLRGAAAGP